MKFSVLMSLYCGEHPENLRECLHSLSVQTQAADEIILVFDGAISLELEQVIAEYVPKLPIHIFRLPENVGLGKALNFGLNHCSHDWIFRMDTDDIAVPTRFALQCAFIQTHPNIQLFGGQITEFVTQPEQCHAIRSVPTSLLDIISFAKKRNPFNHMTIAYQKKAVQNVGGYQHHLYMEDYNLWLRMLAAGVQAANLPDILVSVRTGDAMLSRRHGWTYVQSEWQLFRLKRQLDFQAALPAFAYFLLRSLPRILPETLLRLIYRVTRNITK
jgi:hypothetical protein